MTACPMHLKVLEAESIYILREAAAQAARPVLLYSIGKDSSVLLHLARKAFFPARPPWPLLHIDTTWKFQDMIRHRDETANRYGLDLKVYTNTEGVRQNVNPFDHGSNLYTQIMKTDALKQALSDGQYDIAIAGARRDEERSRAKERVFSVRAPGHVWDPKRQRPELWRLYNGSLAPVRPCASSRSQTGPSATSGPTSWQKVSRSFRCTLRRSVRLSCETAH